MIGTGPYVMEKYAPSRRLHLSSATRTTGTRTRPVDTDRDADHHGVRGGAGAVQGRQHLQLATPPRQRGRGADQERGHAQLNMYQRDVTAGTDGRVMASAGCRDGKSPFLDERVRQAFSMAWDRDLFIDAFYNVSKFEAAGPAGRDALEHVAVPARTRAGGSTPRARTSAPTPSTSSTTWRRRRSCWRRRASPTASRDLALHHGQRAGRRCRSRPR